MAINIKYKTIFIHIPKTAGSSMELKTFVGQEGKQTHWSLNMFKSQLRGKSSNYFKWCFSRNPYDRLISSYHWGIKNHKQRYLKDINSFNDFIDKIDDFYDFENPTSVNQTRSGIHVIPQHVFVNDNICELDFIGKFENINEDFKKLCLKIEQHSGITIEDKTLPVKKKTNHKHWKEYYNKDIYQKINKLYKKDFDLFGYHLNS